MSHRFAPRLRDGALILQLLETWALGLWIGCMTGFAFLFAPIAFHTIGNLNLFAALIGATVSAICTFGYFLGGIALATTIPFCRQRLTALRQCCVIFMLLAMLYEQHAILPTMAQTLHAIGPGLASMPHNAPLRRAYDALHRQSSIVFSVTLILGFIALGLGVFERGRLTENPRSADAG